ncbi:unnamed protein product [marine sediment metagenome]|uniref:Uncharacterized protein n=1 Tax=marine sediment metagenome TaxID=412755 RepID=X1D5D0_9ZZZZ
MGKGAIWIGIALIILGIFLAYEVITSTEAPNWLLIHLLVLIGIGIGLIVFFRAEDKIEKRKDIKGKDK